MSLSVGTILMIIATAWLLKYLLITFMVVRPLLRLLPVDSPEKLQEFWNQRSRRNRPISIFSAATTGAAIYYIFELAYSSQRREPGLNLAFWFFVFVFGLIIIISLANLPLDRALRGSTWSAVSFLRHRLGLLGTVQWPSWSLLLAPLICGIVAPDRFPSISWRILLFTELFLSFALLSIVLRWIGYHMLGLRPTQDNELIREVESMAELAHTPMPRLRILPERGGKAPWAFVVPSMLVLSEFIIDKLPADQLRAVIGHEFAHYANGDLKRRYRRIMLCCIVGFILPTCLPGDFMLPMISESPFFLIAFMIAPVLIGLLGQRKKYRQEEFNADRLSAQWIGNSEVMAQALIEVHALARLPERYPQEKKMVHPSQVQRIEALRNMLIVRATPPPLP